MAEEKNITDQPPKKSNKKAVIIISIVAILIIAILVAVIVWLLNREEVKPEVLPNTSGRGVVIDENTPDDELNPPADNSTYTTEQRSEWTFPSGAGPASNSYVRNNERNENPVYFNVELRENAQSVEGTETVYESPILKVGDSITNISLNRRLDPGDYDAILTYHIIEFTDASESNYRELKTVSTGLVLHIRS